MILATLTNDLYLGAAFISVMGALFAGIGLIIRVTRVIDGQLEAMKENTAAIHVLTARIEPLQAHVAECEERLDHLEPVVFRDPQGRFQRRRPIGDAA